MTAGLDGDGAWLTAARAQTRWSYALAMAAYHRKTALPASACDRAGAIMVALREAGAQVTALPARAVRESVAGYDLILLGAPLYSGRWHRDAHRFLKRHRRELTAVPVAVFGMGPRNDTGEAWRRSRAQLDRALARHGWITPVMVTVFGGVDPPGRASRGTRPLRDLRDWRAIRTWAADTRAAAAQGSQGRSTAGR